jgi:TM2 domain-containing membrane protein YozV
MGEASEKSRLTTTLLAYFLGVIGVHRFYLGKVGTGILMIITLGGFGIWWLIDFIMAVAGSMKDKEGKPIKLWNPSGSEDQTALPMAAGILSIVAGALALISGITALGASAFAGSIVFGFGLAGIPSIIFAIVAIVGGVFAIQRKIWWLALVGSIFALLSTFVLGIPAIIFTALSQKEFAKS